MNVFQWLKLGAKLKRVEKEVAVGGAKAWFNSKTMAGIFISFTPAINLWLGKKFGYQILDPEGFWPDLLDYGGRAFAIYGRYVAKVPLTLTTPKPDAPPAE